MRGVSVRDVARTAKVDPALIYRYFANKEHLFLEALRGSFTIVEAPPAPGGFHFDGVGERIVYRFLTVWGRPEGSPMLVHLLRAASEDKLAARQFRDVIERTIVPATRVHLGGEAPRRAPLVGSVLLGLGVLRYLVRVEPLASMTDEEVAALAGPVVTRIIEGAPRRASRTRSGPKANRAQRPSIVRDQDPSASGAGRR